MSRRIVRAFLIGVVGCAIVGVVAAQGVAPQTFKGLQMTVTGVERAPSASLKDCPPGTNTVNAMTRPGEQFALVTVAFKALPAIQQSLTMKRPSVTDTAGKTYNTSVSFVDVASLPEFSCVFPFRIPDGTKLKSLQIETASFDLSALDK